MSKRIKFTPAKLASLKHPIGKYADKRYALGYEGLAVFVTPQPSLTKLFYAFLSNINYGVDGKKKNLVDIKN